MGSVDMAGSLYERKSKCKEPKTKTFNRIPVAEKHV